MRRVIKTVFDPDGSPRQIPVLRDFFIYTINVDSVPYGGDTVTRSINFSSDADFVWLKTTYQLNDPNFGGQMVFGGNIVPAVTVEIKDSGSSRDFQSTPTFIHNIAGRGVWPAILPEPRVFKANTTAQFKFRNPVNYTVVDYKNIFINLIGYKEWQ